MWILECWEHQKRDISSYSNSLYQKSFLQSSLWSTLYLATLFQTIMLLLLYLLMNLIFVECVVISFALPNEFKLQHTVLEQLLIQKHQIVFCGPTICWQRCQISGKIEENTKTGVSMLYFYTRIENTVTCNTKTGCIILYKKQIFISSNMFSKLEKCQNAI